MTQPPPPVIVIVGHDRLLRRSIAVGLQQAGYRVVEKASIESGIEMVRCTCGCEQTHKPDCAVLLDDASPDDEPWESVSRVVKASCDCPVLVMCTDAECESRCAALPGVAGVVRKPFGLDRLVDLVAGVTAPPRDTPEAP